MRYRRLTENWDYSFGNNSRDYTTASSAVGYAIKSKLLLFYGEWWENLGIGIPMFQSFLGQKNTENLKGSLQLLIEQRIKEIPEVVSIGEVDIESNDRTFRIRIDCTVENGEDVEVEVEFYCLM